MFIDLDGKDTKINRITAKIHEALASEGQLKYYEIAGILWTVEQHFVQDYAKTIQRINKKNKDNVGDLK